MNSSETSIRVARPDLLQVDFDERPFTVAWELTRSCALHCLHCRAEAQPRRHPDELTTREAYNVIDQIRDLAPPVLVLTGGDPLMRPDLFELVSYAVKRGLRVSVSPTTTSLSNRPRMERLRDSGVHMVHVSLDGATPGRTMRSVAFPAPMAGSSSFFVIFKNSAYPRRLAPPSRSAMCTSSRTWFVCSNGFRCASGAPSSLCPRDAARGRRWSTP